VAKIVVGIVWPELCEGHSQRHQARITSCVSKTALPQSAQEWMRVHLSRCPQHLVFTLPRPPFRILTRASTTHPLAHLYFTSTFLLKHPSRVRSARAGRA
jgi:hypothetical protein